MRFTKCLIAAIAMAFMAAVSTPAVAQGAYPVADCGAPFKGKTPVIGKKKAVIKAVFFNDGANGVAYYHNPELPTGDRDCPRPGLLLTRYNNTGDGYMVLCADEWARYTVKVEKAGTYDFNITTVPMREKSSFCFIINGKQVGENMDTKPGRPGSYDINGIELQPGDYCFELKGIDGNSAIEFINVAPQK